MKLTAKNSSGFTPHPEHTGPAICVDVTPLKHVKTRFGDRDVFRLVFETTQLRADGSPFLVWSSGFTPSLHEKASFRKFMKGWMGRDLTAAEQEEFDTETLIGRTAQLVITHSEHNGTVFANIAACTPLRSGTIKASGKYVRVKDREEKGDQQFNRADQPGDQGGGDDWKATKVHVGRHAGIELRDLEREAVEALIDHWLPEAKGKAKQTADDKRLIAALEQAAKEFDNIPY
jgi:hypothetical protein